MTHQVTDNSEDTLFTDMEKRVGSTGWCTGLAIIWVSVIVLAIGIVVIFSITKQGTVSLPQLTSLNLPGSRSTADVRSTTLTVHITEGELTELLRVLNPPKVKDTTATIETRRIVVTGTTTSVPELPIVIALRPKVDSGGALTIEVLDATISGIRFMPIVDVALRGELASRLEDLIHSRVGGTITNITLSERRLTATVVPTL